VHSSPDVEQAFLRREIFLLADSVEVSSVVDLAAAGGSL
jgi:hypothetical protein